MKTDLVEVITEDGISLAGAYFAPEADTSRMAIEAICFFHGDSGHFYRRLYLELGQYLASQGVAFLSANRRGHDTIANGVRGGPPKGYAFESVDESRLDYAAWLDLLHGMGHQTLGIGGHSGGAVRSVYAQSKECYPGVSAVLAISPGEYDHPGLIKLHGDQFVTTFAHAEAEVAAGRPDTLLTPGIPWACTWSSGAFVDCFNPDNRYSVLKRVTDVNCPVLFVFGALECVPAGQQALPVCGAAMRHLRSARLENVTVEVIDDANHGYDGQTGALFGTVLNWLGPL